MSLVSPELAVGFFTISASWEACFNDFLENSCVYFLAVLSLCYYVQAFSSYSSSVIEAHKL